MDFPLKSARVWVAGHRGMLGSAIARRLVAEDCEVLVANRSEVDLTRQVDVETWMHEHRPDAIFVAAAKVGGILANENYPAQFLYNNLMIQANIAHAAFQSDTEKVMFLGSSCIYPRMAEQPIMEDALLTGALEPTNEAYAIAKIAGIKLAQAYRQEYQCEFIAAMPTNLYGPGDNFDLTSSHVLPALIRKAHEAKQSGAESFTIWGTGAPRREFLHVDDCADALILLMRSYSGSGHINVGSGEDLSIYDLARMVAEVVGFNGDILCDPSKPDGTPRKLMSVEKLRTVGWQPKISLVDGIMQTYQWFLQHDA
jgi:GDP-L-fucose synthase